MCGNILKSSGSQKVETLSFPLARALKVLETALSANERWANSGECSNNLPRYMANQANTNVSDLKKTKENLWTSMQHRRRVYHKNFTNELSRK